MSGVVTFRLKLDMNCNRGLPPDFTLYWILHTFYGLLHHAPTGARNHLVIHWMCHFYICIQWTVLLQDVVLAQLMIPAGASPCMDTVSTEKRVYVLHYLHNPVRTFTSHTVYMFTWTGALVFTFLCFVRVAKSPVKSSSTQVHHITSHKSFIWSFVG